jgi:hypothetical protein
MDVVRIFGTSRWAFETPKAGGKVSKSHLTQVGQALARLGIEHIPSYSPQARGRSERMNRTLQDRLVKELTVAGARTLEQANRYMRERYLLTHNDSLAREPREPESAFVALGDVDLNELLCIEAVRSVGKDNVVSFEGLPLQIAAQPGRRTCAGLHVTVRRHLDGSHSIRRGTQLFGRYNADGAPLQGPVEAAGPVGNRQRTRFPTRTLDAGRRRRRPQLPQASSSAKL